MSGDLGSGAPVAPSQTSEPSDSTRSLGEIVGAVTADLGDLFKAEVELAKTELKQEGMRAGRGAALLAGAAIGGLLLLVFASLALMYLLDDVMDLELAALVVAVVWGVVAGALAAAGRSQLKKANPQLPQTQQTLKEDAQWARAQKS